MNQQQQGESNGFLGIVLAILAGVFVVWTYLDYDPAFDPSLPKQGLEKTFLVSRGKYFPQVRDILSCLSDDNLKIALGLRFTNPTRLLMISLTFGGFGVDRFLLGMESEKEKINCGQQKNNCKQ